MDESTRAKLSEAIGETITPEVVDKMIEATKSEAAFIENQIKLLNEATEAMLNKENPIFAAESHDYNSMLTLHYGTDLLNLDGSFIKPLNSVY
jgi:hypothetical protein